VSNEFSTVLNTLAIGLEECTKSSTSLSQFHKGPVNPHHSQCNHIGLMSHCRTVG